MRMANFLERLNATLSGPSHSAIKGCCSLALTTCALVCGSPAEAVIELRVDQVGDDVVVTGSGKANVAALTFASTSNAFQNVLTDVQIYAGPVPSPGGRVDLYDGILTGPLTISSNPLVTEIPDDAASTGDLFGMMTSPYQLVLPEGYVSDTELSGVSIYRNATLASLGLIPGTATWTWGTAGDGTFDRLNLVVVPGPLPIAGAGMTYGWCRKLRRRATMGNRM